MQTLLEKNPSGIMGRDLRRLYKEMFSRELPLSDFNVQRPIELIEKELADTVYYTREGDGDVKYFLKKKTLDSGPSPLWHLTCHGDDNCISVVPGDTSFEEMKLQAYWSIWCGQNVQQIQEREKKMEQESKQRFDSYQASKNAQANQQSNSNPSNPFGSNQNPFASAFGQPQAQSSIFPASGNSFGNSLGGGLFGQSSQQQPQNPMQPQQQSSIQPISGFLTNTPSTTANSGNNLFSGGIFGSQSQPAMQKQEPLVPQENRNVQSGSLFSSPQPFQQSNLFGSSTAGQSSIFGSNPPAPAAQNPTGTSLFGGSQQPGASNSLFGGTNPPQPTTTGGLFGSNNALGGGSGGLFGNPANTASPTSSGGLFGSTINAPKPPQTSLFGSGSSNLFGQGPPTTTQSNLFGGSAPTSGVGNTATGTSGGLFGSTNPTSSSLFSSPNSNLFGGSTQSGGGLFGGSMNPQQQQQQQQQPQQPTGLSGGLFSSGAQPSTTGGLFGGLSPAQQNSQSSSFLGNTPFGGNTQGGLGSIFGSQQPQQQQQQQQSTLSPIPNGWCFRPTTKSQSMEPKSNKSSLPLDPIRWDV
ncbi:hypothetical protein GUITHDRAFT_105374 [Guillardia theta CCMP2712]|uniref:HTH OST-type domain-containing protein n=1 Tax=Guillardia theta (strain CCMP2712) TaxID=905079 RepID=L1JKX9_GUITC|nr:hypothetical protein GUITHDRAFT_105374 [Guillardia theta CCMP2712]EKX48745.1 hypothetical protein GUITHDRAFT_105374 [Guillardia theta CCMP2712]|eukprot:XP_005835725.1 hypothetical protein GUITHDRAFT_105374 [Guillardia theta CCMP2712]